MPHCRRTEGRVRSTKPLNYGGSLIEDFSVTFAEGRIVEVAAAQGEDILRNLVETDDGAARLGEIALVPNSSPVSQFRAAVLQHPVRRERLQPRRPRPGVQRLPGERRRHGGGGVLRRGREPQRRARRLHDRLWGNGYRRGAFDGTREAVMRAASGRWRCRYRCGSVVAVGQAQLREQARQLGAGLRVEGNPLALAPPALAVGALPRHEDLVEPGGLARGLEPGYQLLDRPSKTPRDTKWSGSTASANTPLTLWSSCGCRPVLAPAPLSTPASTSTSMLRANPLWAAAGPPTGSSAPLLPSSENRLGRGSARRWRR